MINSSLTLCGIIVASFFAYQQNQINQNLLKLNLREQIDFKFDESSYIANLKNYSSGPIYIEAVNIQASSSEATLPIQQILFPLQESKQSLKDYAQTILPGLKDGFYLMNYKLLISSDIESNRNNKKYKIAYMQMGLYVDKGQINNIVPQFGFSSYYDYKGSAQDFHRIISR